jgi:putative ABC transport system ATP-binding protein
VTSAASTTDASSIFQARGVSKTYRQGTITVDAVSDVNLSIVAGEFVVLAGPSGSGKTTLLNLMGGLDQPDRGTMWFAGTNLGGSTEAQRLVLRRDRLGFIFQAFNLVPVLSAYENVEYGLWLTGRPRAERRARVLKALADVSLTHRLTHRPDHLSGGERQRVALARALVHDPLAVLADEPTASLDSWTGAEMVELFKHLNATRGTTFVVATHDPAVVAVSPRVIRLVNGRLAGGPHGEAD